MIGLKICVFYFLITETPLHSDSLVFCIYGI